MKSIQKEIWDMKVTFFPPDLYHTQKPSMV
uniref:Uncharacterized protein n=1 Tax=Anguilla anguilla TaxID=7936 RepID=A0A0E9S5L7_ANGAN